MHQNRFLPIFIAAFSLFMMACICNPTGIDIPFVRSPIDLPAGAFDGEGRSGEELFKALVLDPMPSSVTVLNSEDETPLLSPTVYLHFSIASEEFPTIIAADDWIRQDLLLDSDPEPHVADWWAADDLAGLEIYRLSSPTEGCKCIKTVWVNADHTEVYFQVEFL